MSKPKLLVPSAGQKVVLMRELERYFEVYACGFAPANNASACLAAGDRFVEQPEGLVGIKWQEWLLGVCSRLNIDAILPVRDGDMLHLDTLRDKGVLKAMGVQLILSPRETIHAANDKLDMFEMLNGTSVYTPFTWLCEEHVPQAAFPVLVKPQWGAGSVGILRAASQESLHQLKKSPDDERWVVQNEVVGQEYTVDAFYGVDGRLMGMCSRERITVKDGQMWEGRVVSNAAIKSAVVAISQQLKFVGPVNMQFIVDEDGKPWLIDINLRFGGGTRLTIAAGCDFVLGLRQLVDGEPVDIELPKIGTRAIGFTDYVFEEAK